MVEIRDTWLTPARLFERFVGFLRRPIVMSVAALIGTGLLYKAENYWATLPFAILIVALLAGLLFAPTRKVAFSFYTAFMIIGLVAACSFVKFKMRGFSLHFYDIVFYGKDPEAISFLLGTYAHLIVPILVIALCMVAASIVLFQYDKKLLYNRRYLALGIVVPAILLPVAYPSEAREERYFYYLVARHATAFFVSLLDIEYLFTDGKLEQRLASIPPQIPFQNEVRCGKNSPDVFVVLSETQFNPADFPQLDKGKFLNGLMSKANGPLQPLNVETFGGGTWISNLSLMTGLSATEFGWRSPYLTIELEGKVRGALPELFSKCGYRTVTLMPFEFSFVNEGPFLKSIGFESIYDKDAIGAPYYRMRDQFYYDAAEKIIATHRKNDNRPLFFVIQTMYPHSPYENRRDPELRVEGEPLHSDPQIAEYLRRIVIARQDLGSFLEKRRKEIDTRGAVFLDFGDHQSFSTKSIVEETAGVDALSTPGSLAYRTFYTMQYISPDGDKIFLDDKPVDIGFLGARLLKFA